MIDPDAEVWRHTFEPGPDFTLEVRGIVVGRVYRNDTIPAPPRWYWTITCVSQFVGVSKPSKTDSGFCHTKEEAIEALRAAWALERDRRAEMRGLLGFARGLGLDAATVGEIYEAVGRKAMLAGAGDDDRMAEVRKRMLAAARQTRQGGRSLFVAIVFN